MLRSKPPGSQTGRAGCIYLSVSTGVEDSIPEKGKRTYGLDWFYNGSANRTQKGLEISVIAVVDVTSHRAYSLSVQQTPANLGERRSKSCPPSVERQTIEQVRQMLQHAIPLHRGTKTRGPDANTMSR